MQNLARNSIACPLALIHVPYVGKGSIIQIPIFGASDPTWKCAKVIWFILLIFNQFSRFTFILNSSFQKSLSGNQNFFPIFRSVVEIDAKISERRLTCNQKFSHIQLGPEIDAQISERQLTCNQKFSHIQLGQVIYRTILE